MSAHFQMSLRRVFLEWDGHFQILRPKSLNIDEYSLVELHLPLELLPEVAASSNKNVFYDMSHPSDADTGSMTASSMKYSGKMKALPLMVRESPNMYHQTSKMKVTLPMARRIR